MLFSPRTTPRYNKILAPKVLLGCGLEKAWKQIESVEPQLELEIRQQILSPGAVGLANCFTGEQPLRKGNGGFPLVFHT